jgi:hypothetical protein
MLVPTWSVSGALFDHQVRSCFPEKFWGCWCAMSSGHWMIIYSSLCNLAFFVSVCQEIQWRLLIFLKPVITSIILPLNDTLSKVCCELADGGRRCLSSRGWFKPRFIPNLQLIYCQAWTLRVLKKDSLYLQACLWDQHRPRCLLSLACCQKLQNSVLFWAELMWRDQVLVSMSCCGH